VASIPVGQPGHSTASDVPSTIHCRAGLCRQWAKVIVEAQSIGRRIESAEAWIAATPFLHDALLLTNNRNDYVRVIGLKLISHARSSIVPPLVHRCSQRGLCKARSHVRSA
jgi:hypothetical protein